MKPAKQVEQEIRRWLQQVVIGLNLCPFAARPAQEDAIRIKVSDCGDQASLLQVLFDELELLREISTSEVETTLLVLTDVLQDFDGYNQFLDLSDQLLIDRGWQGMFQIATFHPQYCFAGVAGDAAENLTNRSPYPILHLLREESLARALESYPNPEEIPQRNIRRMEALTLEEKNELFPYLFTE